MPTVALSRISSCSASARCTRKSASRSAVTSSKLQIHSCSSSPTSMRRPRVRQRKIEPSRRLKRHSASWVPPGEVVEVGERAGALPVVLVGEEHATSSRRPARPGPAPTISSRKRLQRWMMRFAHEGDADRGVVEDQLLLGERALDALLGLVLLRDVLEEPHRALRRVARLHRAARERAPDGACRPSSRARLSYCVSPRQRALRTRASPPASYSSSF